jgi:hypothetical protein
MEPENAAVFVPIKRPASFPAVIVAGNISFGPRASQGPGDRGYSGELVATN